jgi:tRNA pseudouridine38-40 synthase
MSSETQRVAIVIQYLGTNFYGWQRQANHRSVQEEIESAIASVVNHQVRVIAAGRTDTGVHAAGQVAHFDVKTLIPAHRWADILNNRLDKDIVIRASAKVEPPWHARFTASSRRYRYTVYTDRLPNLFIRPLAWHYYHAPLDQFLIQKALDPLMGTHHLGAFHRAGSQRDHSWVDIQAAECQRAGSFIYIEVQANGFLYGMMRLLVGLLVQVGSMARSPENFTDIWVNERRELVKYAAPAQGLCLLRVGYPDFPFPPDIWYDTQPKFMFG